MDTKLIEEWSNWSDVHELPDQLKRIDSAKKANLTPYRIDDESGCGYFVGSASYETFLDRCNCSDFARRKLPCKHMYRVAMELGLFEAEYKSGKPRERVKSNSSNEFSKVKDKLEALNSSERQIVYCYVCNHYAGEPYVISAKNDEALLSLLSKEIMTEIPINYEAVLWNFKVSEVRDFLRIKNVEYDKSLRKKADLYRWVMEECDDILPELTQEYGCYSLSSDFDSCLSHVRSFLAGIN